MTAERPSADDVSFAFVVPAHNEAGHLAACVTLIADHVRGHPGSEILVVENGSTDDTWRLVQQLAAQAPDDVAVRAHRSEPGLSNAYRVGAAEATADIVVFTAADLPFGFSDVDHYLGLPSEARPDFAIGSKAHPDSMVDRSLTRRAMSMGLFAARWCLLGSRIGDTQGSLLIRRDLAQRIVPSTVGGGFVFGAEVAASAEAEGCQPVEIPVEMAEERRASKVRPIHDSLAMIADLVTVRRHLDRESEVRGRHDLVDMVEPGRILRAMVGGARLEVLVAATAVGAVLSVALFVATLALIDARIATLVADDGLPSLTSLRLSTLGVIVLVALVVGLGAALIGRSDRAARWRDQVATAATWSGSQMLAVSLVAAAVSIVLGLWKVLPHLTTHAVGSGDARYWYWLGWRAAEQVRDGDLVVGGVTSVIWPLGSDLWATDGVLTAVVGTFWNLVVSDPTLAFNLAVATALATTAAAGVRLARTLDADPWLAAVAGVAIGTGPALAIRLEGHFNLLFAFPAILAIDAGLRHVIRRTQPFPVARVACLLVLCYLSSGYYFVWAGLALGAIVLFAGRGPRWIAAALVRLGAAAVLALLVLSPFLVPKLDLEAREADLGAVPQGSLTLYSSDATSIVTPPDGTLASVPSIERYNDGFGANVLEGTAFIGFLGVIGLGALVLYRSPVTRSLMAAAVALYVVGLGNVYQAFGENPVPMLAWLPAQVFLDLPGFAGVRAPNRTSFVLLPLGVAAAVVVVRFFRSRARTVTSVACLAACTVLVAISVRVPVNQAPEIDGDLEAALEGVRDLDDPGAVLHLPDDCLLNLSQIEMQIDHGQPEVGCQNLTSAVPWRSGLGVYAASEAWPALRCEPGRIGPLPTPAWSGAEPSVGAVERLRDELDVGVVIFDRENTCPDRGEVILDTLVEAGSVVGDDGRFVVVAVP